MNQITTLVNTYNGEVTMSSREIADLTGKRHDNVMADIRKMLAEIQSPEKLGDYTDSKNRTQQMLLL
ncbi:TPA: Rha family transcriptional regulator, partial [Providencia stuartii]